VFSTIKKIICAERKFGLHRGYCLITLDALILSKQDDVKSGRICLPQIFPIFCVVRFVFTDPDISELAAASQKHAGGFFLQRIVIIFSIKTQLVNKRMAIEKL
jgi:hypothetical protein